MMRIITGSARGVRLDTLEGEMTRPTTERAKEAVFSILRARLLAPGGLIVCESGEPDPLGFGTGTALSGHFSLLREAKYGKAYITLVTAASATGAGGDES